MYYLLEGEMERGLTECEQALRLDPSIPGSYFCMGLHLADQGDTEQARQEFRIVVATAPGMVAEQVRRQLDRLD